jgi:hypothetical protein
MKIGATVISKLRSTLSFALVFWCAGAGCLMVSYARGAAMDGSAPSSERQSSDRLHSMGAHECCKARHFRSKARSFQTDSISGASTDFREALLPAAPIDSGVTSCCPLTSGSFISASATKSDNENPANASQRAAALLGTIRLVAPPALIRRLPDQNQTYLRSCAFLI